MKKFYEALKGKKETGIILVLLVMCVGIGSVNPAFFRMSNVTNLARSAAYLIVIGMPMTMILITGGIDLSVGSSMGLGGIMAAYFMVNMKLPVVPSIVLSLVIAVVVGVINGYIVISLKVPAFMGTLGMMYIVRGAINVITQASPIFPLPDGFQSLAGSWFKFSYVVWFALVEAVVFHVLMSKTKLGRYAYAVGGNIETARLSGVSVNQVQRTMYVLSSLFAAIAGIFSAARIGSAQIAAGEGWELDVVAACVIGGASTLGGAGTALGTCVGALVSVILKNAMVLLKISAYWQKIVIGLVLIAVVSLDQYKHRRAFAPKKEKKVKKKGA